MPVPPKHFLSAGKPRTKLCVKLIVKQPTLCMKNATSTFRTAIVPMMSSTLICTVSLFHPRFALSQVLMLPISGLHPEEAVEYLEDILLQHEKGPRRVIYAITGTGHHSKNGKDKVGKGVRGWLNEGGWSFREFSVPGERGGYVGGVLGIDVSGRRSMSATGRDEEARQEGVGLPGPGFVIGEGRVRVLKREESVGS